MASTSTNRSTTNNSGSRQNSGSASGTKKRKSSSGQGKAGTRTQSSARKPQQEAAAKENEKEKDPITRPEEASYALRSEILAIVFIAAAIYLFLCNFGMCGVVGGALSNVMFGLFGFLAYFAPLLISGAAVFYISNQGSVASIQKIAAGAGLTADIGIMAEIVSGGELAPTYSIASIYLNAVSGHSGGGAIFGSLAYLFYHTISIVGTILLLVVTGAVCVVVLTQHSFLHSLKRGGSILKDRAMEDATYYKEQAQERHMRLEEKRFQIEEEKRMAKQQEEDEKILRMDRRITGVASNTDLKMEGDDEEDMEDEEYLLEEATREGASQAEEDIFVPDLDNGEIHDDVHEIIFTDTSDGEIRTEVEPDGQHRFADGPMIHGYAEEEDEEEAADTDVPQSQRDEEERERQAQTLRILEETRRVHAMANAAQTQEDARHVIRMAQEDDEEDNGMYESAGSEEANGTDSRLTARLAPEEDPEEDYPDIPVHAGGLDYGNGISEAGYAIHAQDHVSAGRSEQKIISGAKAPSYMPGEISYSNGQSGQNTSREAYGGTAAGAGNGTQMAQEVQKAAKKVPRKYVFPPLNLLNPGQKSKNTDSARVLKETAQKLEKTLKTFGVNVTVTDISQGPTVTRYEVQPEVGVKVSKIVNLQDDIKLNLAATDIRIEAPIPGKAAVGIEVPNKENVTVSLRELLEAKEFRESSASLAFAVGKDIGGKTVVTDIAKMPHVLIAGATGSGKSVCINTMILSLIYKSRPEDVKMIMIDPKVVELSIYNGIPHLLIPVVTDPKKAAAALNWAVAEMTRRYKLFAAAEVRDLKGYNEYVTSHMAEDENLQKLPKIVIIVDELADLMMVSANEVEEAICRLAQLARACGIHLVIATQRPSVDVITGLIKANMPSRVAFAVSSGTDSRTILDMNGAEKLLGKGDMLFYPQSMSKPVRLQGAFVSDGEIQKITDFLKEHAGDDTYDDEIQEQMQNMESSSSGGSGNGGGMDGPDRDEYFADAGRFIIDKEKASIGMLQRVFKIGFNRAARIMDQLCEAGVVGDEEGTKPRKVLMTKDEFEDFLKN